MECLYKRQCFQDLNLYISVCVLSRFYLIVYLVAMPFTAIFCLSLLAAFHASAQSTCTTLQPVFELQADATSTVFRSTITSTSSVDCAGCSLVVSTFTVVAVGDLPVLTLPYLTTNKFLVL